MIAFSQGHISCFFRPVRSNDPMRSGSLGIGMRTDLGAQVTVEECTSGVSIFINGELDNASVTRNTVNVLAPDRGFDIHIRTELPVSQGFGMSAAGSIATGLCICEICGIDPGKAYEAAHISDVTMGGGLGDVAGIYAEGPVVMRTKEGFNTTTSFGECKDIVIAVLGDSIKTKDILFNKTMMEKTIKAGDRVLNDPIPYDAKDIIARSRRFSDETGLETNEVSAALRMIPDSAMCMLGNSIFSFSSEDFVRDILPDAEIFTCRTTNARPFIRKE